MSGASSWQSSTTAHRPVGIITEWLFFEHSTEAAANRAGYGSSSLSRYMTMRADRLNHLKKDEPVWRYRSDDFDVAVLDNLTRHWPLDYGKL